MATKRTTKSTVTRSSRYAELRKILETRRQGLLSEMQGRMRDVRAIGSRERDGADRSENSDVDIQDDIELALIQMKSETLNKINQALRRLEEDVYGNCFECGDNIAAPRLKALPFAVRCKDCEELRENTAQQERPLAQRRGATMFYDIAS